MFIQLIKPISIISLLFVSVTVACANEPLLEEPGLVSTEWLAENIDHPQVRVIDARPSLGSYLQGHLPGAIYLNTESLRFSREGVPAQLHSPERLAEMFGEIGIGSQHTVIVYSSAADSFAHATYIAYVLEWLGHQAIGVVDGGIEKWTTEERDITSEFPAHVPARLEAGVPEIALLRTTREVMHSAFRKQAVILDARSPEQFQSGHIPSAENFFLERTLTGEGVKTWKTADEILALAAAVGADGTQPIITYCTSGREASQIWFTLHHVADLEDVSNYHGSWIQWTADQQPILTSQQ